jgi:hypothetical protein
MKKKKKKKIANTTKQGDLTLAFSLPLCFVI